MSLLGQQVIKCPTERAVELRLEEAEVLGTSVRHDGNMAGWAKLACRGAGEGLRGLLPGCSKGANEDIKLIGPGFMLKNVPKGGPPRMCRPGMFVRSRRPPSTRANP